MTTTAGGLAVSGARVGVTQAGALLGSGVTDGMGVARIALDAVRPARPWT